MQTHTMGICLYHATRNPWRKWKKYGDKLPALLKPHLCSAPRLHLSRCLCKCYLRAPCQEIHKHMWLISRGKPKIWLFHDTHFGLFSFFLKEKTERSDTAYEKNNASMLWSETHIMLHLEYEMLRLFLLKVLQYCLFMGPQRTASCVGLKRSVQTSEQEIPCLGDVNPLKTKIWDNKTYYICYYLFFFTFWINICFDCFIYKGVKVIWLIYFLFLGSNQIGLSDTESNRLIPLKNGLELDQFIIKSKL